MFREECYSQSSEVVIELERPLLFVKENLSVFLPAAAFVWPTVLFDRPAAAGFIVTAGTGLEWVTRLLPGFLHRRCLGHSTHMFTTYYAGMGLWRLIALEGQWGQKSTHFPPVWALRPPPERAHAHKRERVLFVFYDDNSTEEIYTQTEYKINLTYFSAAIFLVTRQNVFTTRVKYMLQSVLSSPQTTKDK